MKILKSFFAFFVAALTITLTIAAHAGAFKAEPKKAQPIIQCDPATFPVGSTSPIVNVSCGPIAPCPPSATQKYGVSANYVPFLCNAQTPTVFCCAQINPNVSTIVCSGTVRQPLMNIVCGQILGE